MSTPSSGSRGAILPVGVCMATSGPSATNLVTRSPTPTWTRCRSSPSPARSTPGDRHRRLPEADIRGITMPITKHNYLVTDPADIPRVIAEAFHHRLDRSPRPGLVDISARRLQAQTFILAAANRPAPATAR